jgi:hypothetical protein
LLVAEAEALSALVLDCPAQAVLAAACLRCSTLLQQRARCTGFQLVPVALLPHRTKRQRLVRSLSSALLLLPVLKAAQSPASAVILDLHRISHRN